MVAQDEKKYELSEIFKYPLFEVNSVDIMSSIELQGHSPISKLKRTRSSSKLTVRVTT